MGLSEHLPTQDIRLLSTPPYGDATAAVQYFFTRLKQLRLNAWAAACERPLLADTVDGDAAELRAARHRLRDALESMPHELVRAKRRIEDIAAVAVGFTDEAVSNAMRRAALTAVLALIARPKLADTDFRTLYAPFASLIPLQELRGDV